MLKERLTGCVADIASRNKTGNVHMEVTLSRVRVTIVAVEKQ
jgi:hypothetical protein